MKHFELHIIQSLPVNCVNRDDLNSPKTALFGGIQRARVSSQCWKRAIRNYVKNQDENHLFDGIRSRRFIHQLYDKLIELNITDGIARYLSESAAKEIETVDKKKEDPDSFEKVKTMLFLSDYEYETLAKEIKSTLLDGKEINSPNEIELKNLKKIISKGIHNAHLKDAADIALFGRMVANDGSLQVEAASMFSHAISVHKSDNEIDFFTAIDDLSRSDDPGAGMTGTLEFNTATYYRFVALNLDMLFDKNHLADFDEEQRKSVVSAFIDATICAMPVAKNTSMNANTLPSYVLGIVREKGYPIQLVNAFEKPLFSRNGYLEDSIKLLENEYERLRKVWGIQDILHTSIPQKSYDDFRKGLLEHVN